jgi:hypothetical protein
MRRRDFITLLGGAAAAWPLAARAQRGDRVRRIAVLMTNAEDDPEGWMRAAAFRQGLRELGWTEGQNLRIDWRWSGGDVERMRDYAAEAVALAPDLIVANGAAHLSAVKQATRSIPIVFVLVSDPVGQGFISSLGNPGGNITGFTFVEDSMFGKSLELLNGAGAGALQGLLEGLMSDDTIEVQFWDNTWRTYARGVPDAGVYINRTMQEAARSYPGRRVRAVDDSGKVVDIWT